MRKIILFAFLASAAISRAGTFTNLGPQVTATTIQGSAFLHDDAGHELIYTVERGQPGHVLGYEVSSGKQILDLPLPGDCDGAWNACASPDNYLYTSGGNGHMFRLKPGRQVIQDLGQAPPSEKVVWDVAPGENGEIFGATYPDCRVVSYKPGVGFRDVGNGPLVENENYVRAVVYSTTTKKIYAGIGSHAHLIELDPTTGAKKELLANETAGQEAVYSLQIIPDEKTGDRLLAWVTNRGQTLVFNLRTQTLERTLRTSDVKSAIKSPVDETVYYNNGDKLMSFDLDKPTERPHALIRILGMLATHWIDDSHLCILTRYHQLITFDIHTGTAKTLTLKIPAQPIPIESICLGPDGKMWMGGFLAGGTTAFDPATGQSKEFRGMSQIERFGVLDNQMYLGVYPHGRFYQFDPSQPWGSDNPHKFGQIEGQSRPVTLLGVPELQKVYIGTVPEYGLLGGHLLAYDPNARALKDFGEIVPRQSIVSLAYANNTIIGGTSISGGLGIKPAEHAAKLFGFDPISAKKIFEITPVSNATAITCLINGPDKNIWGIADGTLFIFDPDSRKIVSTHHLINVHYDFPNIWRDAFLVMHPSGQLYGVIDGRFFQLDPITKKITMLRDHGVELLAMDRAGKLYFRETIDLWQYTP